WYNRTNLLFFRLRDSSKYRSPNRTFTRTARLPSVLCNVRHRTNMQEDDSSSSEFTTSGRLSLSSLSLLGLLLPIIPSDAGLAIDMSSSQLAVLKFDC
ncbi:Uncharacterized protein APZ42_004665, partial [Daphnia magna]